LTALGVDPRIVPMTRAAPVLLLVLLLASCSGGGPAKTPEPVTETDPVPPPPTEAKPPALEPAPEPAPVPPPVVEPKLPVVWRLMARTAPRGLAGFAFWRSGTDVEVYMTMWDRRDQKDSLTAALAEAARGNPGDPLAGVEAELATGATSQQMSAVRVSLDPAPGGGFQSAEGAVAASFLAMGANDAAAYTATLPPDERLGPALDCKGKRNPMLDQLNQNRIMGYAAMQKAGGVALTVRRVHADPRTDQVTAKNFVPLLYKGCSATETIRTREVEAVVRFKPGDPSSDKAGKLTAIQLGDGGWYQWQ
jgi:hypothetical protein